MRFILKTTLEMFRDWLIEHTKNVSAWKPSGEPLKSRFSLGPAKGAHEMGPNVCRVAMAGIYRWTSSGNGEQQLIRIKECIKFDIVRLDPSRIEVTAWRNSWADEYFLRLLADIHARWPEAEWQTYAEAETAITASDGADQERTDIERVLSDLETMRQHYQDYSPITAQEILDAIPKAYLLYTDEGGRWGPGIIARVHSLHPHTIGGYLKAFTKIGLTEIDGPEGEKIPIPYKPRKK